MFRVNSLTTPWSCGNFWTWRIPSRPNNNVTNINWCVIFMVLYSSFVAIIILLIITIFFVVLKSFFTNTSVRLNAFYHYNIFSVFPFFCVSLQFIKMCVINMNSSTLDRRWTTPLIVEFSLVVKEFFFFNCALNWSLGFCFRLLISLKWLAARVHGVHREWLGALLNFPVCCDADSARGNTRTPRAL